MKHLIRAAIVTAAIATSTLAPAVASASDFAGGAASATSGSTKTFRCGSDKAACERKQEELRPSNTVGPIGYRPPSTNGRGNYFYFNYTPK